ncbi:hypothetical protein [Campylobacter sp. RM16192]|uniref:hypothetical protein n=1 Tax=Campylobacter sp. RM16192 TaxID=1660080 RepID=UPI001451242E|nr:hypothetical protein [Campylobacter sp. RM16192]QCD53473.1 hypothetical protein CDOMC_1899 [Campylobacter sp. RM16192]
MQYRNGNRVKRAKHIEIRHLSDPTKEGYVTDDELMNLGVNMRKFLVMHKEPFINKRNARIYEWVDKEGVKFTLVATNKTSGGALATPPLFFNPTDFHRLGPLIDEIITFYSDRNFKNPMKFENPKLNVDNARLIDSQMPHPLHTLDVPRGEIINLTDLDKKFIKAYPNVKESFLKNKLKTQRVEKLKKELLNPKTSWKRKTEIGKQIKKELS